MQRTRGIQNRYIEALNVAPKISTSTLALGSSGSGSSVGLPVKPNREKIRAVLKMSNVIELQRQLLTTVMENEVSNRM